MAETSNPSTPAGGSAPGGSTPASPAAAPATPATPSTPSPFKLTDDALVEIEGGKGPVKYGEYSRGLKSEFTRKSQELAKLQPQLKQALDAKADLERRLTLALGGQPKGPDPGAELLNSLGELGYLDGKSARQLAEHMMGRFGSYDQQFQVRDKAFEVIGQAIMKLH